MRKILVVAQAEFTQTVLTKTFLLTVLLMPVIFGAMAAVQWFTRDGVDARDRRFAVVDDSGVVAADLVERAAKRNREETTRDGRQVKPRFLPEIVERAGRGRDELLVELSDRVRSGELAAFVVIGPNVLDIDEGDAVKVEYFSDAPTYDALPDWVREGVNERLRELRFEAAGLDRALVNRLSTGRPFERLGLVELDERGRAVQPKRDDLLETRLVPIFLVLILYLASNLSAPMLLTAVIEEKANRIAESLVSAVPPFALMAGKILATTLTGLIFAGVYLLGAVVFLVLGERLGVVRPELLGWFLVFLVATQVTYGSIFAGIGAACQEVKDAQNFAGLTIPLTFTPMLLLGPVLESPSSPFAVVASLLPPFTPALMLLRVAIPPGPPAWQLVLGLVGMLVFAIACTWAAGRVFRVGLLSTGTAPRLGQLVRWIFR